MRVQNTSIQHHKKACLLAALWLLAVAAGAPVAGAESVDTSLSSEVDAAISATVFLRVEHTASTGVVTGTGTGFLIHPDGWIVTNSHVVSNYVYVQSGNSVRRISTSITSIEAVIASGTDDEIVLPAKVVTRDDKHDLALVKILKRNNEFIDIWEESEPRIGDEVWVIGFPYGEFLSMKSRNSQSVANPEVSVNLGRVSSLRRGDEGILQMVQTDAAVNPGNSGGAMISEDGQLLGVVTAKVGSDGIGFAVSADLLRSFVLTKGYRVRFQPPIVDSESEQLIVSLDSGVIDVATLTATVEIEGVEQPKVSVPFVRVGDSLRASVPLDDGAAEDANKGILFARLRLEVPNRGESVRAFRMRGIDYARSAQWRSAATTGTTMEASLEEKTSRSETERKSLSGGKFGAARSAGGDSEVMISDQIMAEIDEHRFADKYYAKLPGESLRKLAEDYDRAYYDFVNQALELMNRYHGTYYRARKAAKEVKKGLDGLYVLISRTESHQIFRCGRYWQRVGEPCASGAHKPWEDEDLDELRKDFNRIF